MTETSVLICPQTRQPLTLTPDGKSYHTPDHRIAYPIKDGVVCFLAQNDDFYEGAYTATVKWLPKSEKWYHTWPLWGINNGYLWQVRRHVPAGSTVLELGCGGGVAYFGQRYRMLGLDLSFGSLKNVPASYAHKLQADATRLPLPDGSVDAIVSSFFWEHIPHEIKSQMLEEFRRVLTDSGKVIFYYDIETQNPYISILKKSQPEIYRREFIDHDGHLGYETIAQNEGNFIRHSFKLVRHLGIEKWYLLHQSVYSKMAHIGGWAGRYAKFWRKVLSLPFVGYFYLFGIVLTDKTIGRLLDNVKARIVISIYELGSKR
jgi:ubiquinone/menaquinone biosynthesis C-methylase UbiE